MENVVIATIYEAIDNRVIFYMIYSIDVYD